MKLLKLALKPETAIPVLALTFASGMCFALVAARIMWTGKLRYGFLIWNLFLAWLPLIFALLACEKFQQGTGRNLRFLGWAGAWLLFFPNAPYIFTDLIHVSQGYFAHFWVDMLLILSCALTGLILGFVSLFLMQTVVTRIFGRAASWLFIASVAGLSGFGVFVGRFLRFNSWDIVVKPLALSRQIGGSLLTAHPKSLAFPVLFATFLFIAYLLLYALTRLQQSEPAIQSGGAKAN